jgi:hypothetical protein
LPETDAWEQVGADDLSAPVTAITQFSDDTLWAGGEEWVARSDDSGATWTLVGTSGDGIGQDISGLAQDDAGRVWLGAYEGGVSLLEDGAWRALQR